MKKSFLFWIYFVIAIIFATYFATRTIMVSLGYGSVTTIKKVHISVDSKKDNLSQIGAITGITPGTRSFAVSLDDIKARLETVPDIKNSSVRRLANGNIDIKIKMHKIIAVWTDGESFYPVASDGTIVNRILIERPQNLVVFMGKLPTTDLSNIVKSLHTIIDKINYIERIEDRRWNIYTNNNIKIMLPETDPDSAIGQLIILDNKNQILSKNLLLIDMRDNERILVK